MFSDKRHRPWLVGTVGVVLGAASAAGVVSATDGDVKSPPDPQVQSSDTPANYSGRPLAATGAGRSLRDAIAQVDADLGARVTVDTLAGSPLEVHVATPSLDDADDVKTTWTGEIALGALAELHRTDESAYADVLGGLGDVEVKADLPSGKVVDLDGGHGFVAAGQVFAAQADGRDDSGIARSIAAQASRFGLQVVSVDVLHPLGPAPAVVLQRAKGDDAPTWTIDELRNALAGEPYEYEGIYIEIRSTDGEPLLAAGTSYRTGVGGLWFAPGQDEAFGAVHFGERPPPTK